MNHTTANIKQQNVAQRLLDAQQKFHEAQLPDRAEPWQHPEGVQSADGLFQNQRINSAKIFGRNVADFLKESNSQQERVFQPIKPSEFDLQLQGAYVASATNLAKGGVTNTNVSSSTEIGKHYLANLAISGKSAQSGSSKLLAPSGERPRKLVEKVSVNMDQIVQQSLSGSHEDLAVYHQPEVKAVPSSAQQQLNRDAVLVRKKSFKGPSVHEARLAVGGMSFTQGVLQ